MLSSSGLHPPRSQKMKTHEVWLSMPGLVPYLFGRLPPKFLLIFRLLAKVKIWMFRSQEGCWILSSPDGWKPLELRVSFKDFHVFWRTPQTSVMILARIQCRPSIHPPPPHTHTPTSHSQSTEVPQTGYLVSKCIVKNQLVDTYVIQRILPPSSLLKTRPPLFFYRRLLPTLWDLLVQVHYFPTFPVPCPLNTIGN